MNLLEIVNTYFEFRAKIEYPNHFLLRGVSVEHKREDAQHKVSSILMSSSSLHGPFHFHNLFLTFHRSIFPTHLKLCGEIILRISEKEYKP